MRPFKYKNKPCTYMGIKFQSQRERDFYIHFKDLEEKGMIQDLRLQVNYEIIPGIYEDRVKHYVRKPNVVKKVCVQKPVHYRADFVFRDMITGREVIADVKSEITRKDPVYLLKKKIMAALHGLEITEY